jgi:hypothetical protein
MGTLRQSKATASRAKSQRPQREAKIKISQHVFSLRLGGFARKLVPGFLYYLVE